MGRKGRKGDTERELLERILALLLALAGLAERAAGMPLLARLPVLAVLGIGEAAARRFVGAAAFAAAARVGGGSSPAAGRAERLAASFRLLALVLDAMLDEPRCRARSPGRDAALHQAGPPKPSRETAAPLRGRTRAPPAADPPPRGGVRRTTMRSVVEGVCGG